MKVNFGAVLEDFEGKKIVDNERPVTLGAISINSLFAMAKDDNTSGEEKLKRYDLGMRLKKGGVVDVTAEEVTLLKNLIGKFYSVLVVGQAYKILEGEK